MALQQRHAVTAAFSYHMDHSLFGVQQISEFHVLELLFQYRYVRFKLYFQLLIVLRIGGLQTKGNDHSMIVIISASTLVA